MKERSRKYFLAKKYSVKAIDVLWASPECYTHRNWKFQQDSIIKRNQEGRAEIDDYLTARDAEPGIPSFASTFDRSDFTPKWKARWRHKDDRYMKRRKVNPAIIKMNKVRRAKKRLIRISRLPKLRFAPVPQLPCESINKLFDLLGVLEPYGI